MLHTVYRIKYCLFYQKVQVPLAGVVGRTRFTPESKRFGGPKKGMVKNEYVGIIRRRPGHVSSFVVFCGFSCYKKSWYWRKQA